MNITEYKKRLKDHPKLGRLIAFQDKILESKGGIAFSIEDLNAMMKFGEMMEMEIAGEYNDNTNSK